MRTHAEAEGKRCTLPSFASDYGAEERTEHGPTKSAADRSFRARQPRPWLFPRETSSEVRDDTGKVTGTAFGRDTVSESADFLITTPVSSPAMLVGARRRMRVPASSSVNCPHAGDTTATDAKNRAAANRAHE